MMLQLGEGGELEPDRLVRFEIPLGVVFEVPIDALGFAPPNALAAATDTGPAAADSDAGDALEPVTRLTRSDVSPATLDLRARRVDRLCRDYPVRAAPELLGEARGRLDRTLGLLEQRTSLHAHREQLVSVGWLATPRNPSPTRYWSTASDRRGHPSADAPQRGTADPGHSRCPAWRAGCRRRPRPARPR